MYCFFQIAFIIMDTLNSWFTSVTTSITNYLKVNSEKRWIYCWMEENGTKLNHQFMTTYIRTIKEIKISVEFINQLTTSFIKLVEIGWDFETLIFVIMVNTIKDSNDIEQLLSSFFPIIDFQLIPADFDQRYQSFERFVAIVPLRRWQVKIHSLAISKTFTGTRVKSLYELSDEIKYFRRNEQESEKKKKLLLDVFDQVKEAFDDKSLLDDFGGVMHALNGNENLSKVNNWAKAVRNGRHKPDFYEIMAVILRGVQLVTNHEPRNVQILAALLLQVDNRKRGRLLQVNTGEGKTIIVATFAIYQCLQGHKVDVVTSSEELVERQVEELRSLYHLFDITVAHNHNPFFYYDMKKVYEADIVYGTAHDFQADVLRDEFSGSGKRKERKFDVVIVDEVDSMLIDGKDHLVRLTNRVPSMDHLEPLLAAIVVQLQIVAENIVERDGNAFYRQYKDQEQKEFTDHLLNVKKSEFMAQNTETYIRQLIRDVDNLPEDLRVLPEKFPELKVPSHLREFICSVQLKKWINNAIAVYGHDKENRDYVLRGTEVIPVDAINTGVVQINTKWCDGWHQFLQFKHGAKITPETITTNYLSNVSFFKRYGSNVYGLTGTLGGDATIELLETTYGVDCVVMPPFKEKQYKELSSIICRTEEEWESEIVNSCGSKLINGRPVLIINKFINETIILKERFEADARFCDTKIYVYKTEEDSEVIDHTFCPGELIIATNIAGRGTDVKLDGKVEAAGGLHVCVTFLPRNQRVEDQNIGRTSRMGQRGTGQFIIHDHRMRDIAVLRQDRRDQEDANISRSERVIEQVLKRDAIFLQHLELRKELKALDAVGDITIDAVDERFGIWLKCQGNHVHEDDYEKFADALRKDNADTNGHLIANANYHTLVGNEWIKGNVKDEKSRDNAMWFYNKAIEMDPIFSVNSRFNRAYVNLLRDGLSNIRAAMDDFKEVKRIIEDILEPSLGTIVISKSETIMEQVAHKKTLYRLQLDTVTRAIGDPKRNVTQEIADLRKKLLKAESDLSQTSGLVSEYNINVFNSQFYGTVEWFFPTFLHKTNSPAKTLEHNKSILAKHHAKEKELKEEIQSLQAQINYLKEKQLEIEKGVLGAAIEREHEVTVKLIDVKSSLSKDQEAKYFKDEIAEFALNGFMGTFEFNDVKPIPWCSILSLTAIGLAQVIAGGTMAVFTLGIGISGGVGLILEGVGDVITAIVDGVIRRDFSWASWGLQKVVSLSVSIVCAGIASFKAAAKAAISGAQQAAAFGAKVWTESTKQGWKLAAKLTGINVLKKVGMEAANHLIDYGVNQAVIPHFENAIQKQVKGPIKETLAKNKGVQKLLELDAQNRNKHFQNLIHEKVDRLLNDKGHNDILLGVTNGIANGIASNQIKGFSAALKIVDVTQSMVKLATFVPKFTAKLEKEIEAIAKEVENNIEDNQAIMVEKVAIPQESVSALATSSATSHDDDIDHTQFNKDYTQVQQEVVEADPALLVSQLSCKLAENICHQIKNRLIRPATSMATAAVANKASSFFEKNILNSIDLYSKEQRMYVAASGDDDGRLPQGYHQGRFNAVNMDKAEEVIADLENSGQGSQICFQAISDKVGRPIEVITPDGKIYTIVADAVLSGVEPVRVEYRKGLNGESGHYTLPGGEEVRSSGPNNCLFDVVAAQTKFNGQDLRKAVVTDLRTNIGRLADQMPDMDSIKSSNGERSLLMGGTPKAYDGNEAQEWLDNSEGKAGDRQKKTARDPQNPPVGHPSKHIAPGDQNTAPNTHQAADQSRDTNWPTTEDRDRAAHEIFKSPVYNEVRELLDNQQQDRVVVEIPIDKIKGFENFNLLKNGQPRKANSVRIVFEHVAGQKNNPDAMPHIVTIFPMEKELKQINVVASPIEQNTTKLPKGTKRNKSYALRKDGDCKPQDTIKKFDNDKDKDGGGVGLPSLNLW